VCSDVGVGYVVGGFYGVEWVTGFQVFLGAVGFKYRGDLIKVSKWRTIHPKTLSLHAYKSINNQKV